LQIRAQKYPPGARGDWLGSCHCARGARHAASPRGAQSWPGRRRNSSATMPGLARPMAARATD